MSAHLGSWFFVSASLCGYSQLQSSRLFTVYFCGRVLGHAFLRWHDSRFLCRSGPIYFWWSFIKHRIMGLLVSEVKDSHRRDSLPESERIVSAYLQSSCEASERTCLSQLLVCGIPAKIIFVPLIKLIYGWIFSFFTVTLDFAEGFSAGTSGLRSSRWFHRGL